MPFKQYDLILIKIHLTVIATIQIPVYRSRKNTLYEYKATFGYYGAFSEVVWIP